MSEANKSRDRREHLTPRKRLGQNFLRDPNTARRIVAALEAPEMAAVVEIGPGTGALTGELMDRYTNLVAIEVDERAVEVLRAAYPELDVREADVLETDWKVLAEERGGGLYVIGNLPYYITSPILFSLLDARACIRRAVMMMQLEVAERLVAVPKTKRYGILSVMTQLHARPQLLFQVSRNVFFPKPNVTSAVVALDFSPAPVDGRRFDPETVRHVVRTAFNQRRKTLRNSLKSLVERWGVPVPDVYAGCRAEELTPEAFLTLTESLNPDYG